MEDINLENDVTIARIEEELSLKFQQAKKTLTAQGMPIDSSGNVEDKDLFILVLKELRDVAGHLVDAFGQNEQSKVSNLRQAIVHCQRATFVSLEARAGQFLAEFDRFTKEFSAYATEILPADMGTVEGIRESIASIRIEDEEDCSDQYCEQMKTHIASLQKIVRKCRAVKPRLIQTREEQQQNKETEEKREAKKFYVFCLIGIIAIVVAIFFGLATMRHEKSDQDSPPIVQPDQSAPTDEATSVLELSFPSGNICANSWSAKFFVIYSLC